jgi:hypothetical protein
MWIARDKNGGLSAYREKPERQDKMFAVVHNDEREAKGGYRSAYLKLYEEEFPQITWENSPVEIKNIEIRDES